MSVDMWMDYFTHTVSPSVPDLYSIIIISIMESRVKVVKLGDQCAHKGIHDDKVFTKTRISLGWSGQTKRNCTYRVCNNQMMEAGHRPEVSSYSYEDYFWHTQSCTRSQLSGMQIFTSQDLCLRLRNSIYQQNIQTALSNEFPETPTPVTEDGRQRVSGEIDHHIFSNAAET